MNIEIETLEHRVTSVYTAGEASRNRHTIKLHDWNIHMMMMITFITIKSSLVPLIEGLCAQI